MGETVKIILYEHNQATYASALSMLAETGKAAIIHPTGTGKSFIGFKLCDDFPNKTVCWLSPSEYIFKTQIENLKSACGGYAPGNITFYTYAKLMLMDEAELSEIHPDYIILDEFHRCGAEQWGAGVQKLLSMYADTPILGLSATNIRYLDNQRDMADELFDGNVASKMTLGEAIVRGILNPPKYVLSVFSYQNDLEKYERRVRNARNKNVRDAAERYLDALRRALEKADGLDVIFDKHMTDRAGKYIVFCANFEHMREMMDKAPEWFAKVDKDPHIYYVYSNDPSASQSFTDFKEDVDNTHLRLLFCIDALNEGIHVEDISGVILLRPTISPIIYKQQIGRALSVSKANEPIIFDIVNNISGLYSIASVEDEMQEIIQYYNTFGNDEVIINDTFQVIDELRDAKRLFDRLEETLSASWDFMYAEAKAYFEENGNLLPPQSYVSEGGCKLGAWIVSQRINYRNGSGISSARVKKLNEIGMCWQTMHERQWEEGYALAEKYHEKHGNLDTTPEMPAKLSSWIIRQRQKQRDGLLPTEQFERLSKLGMTWEFEDAWELKFGEAKRYYEAHGNLDIPATYVTESGIALGSWYRGVRGQYRVGNLTKERQEKLESIGIKWESVLVRNWMQYYEVAKWYYAKHGNLNVHAEYVTDDGVRLGTWISGQRYNLKKRRITDEQIRLLDEIGMSWQRFDGKWEHAYAYAKKYILTHDKLDPPADYIADDGFALGSWIATQRGKYSAGKLKKNQIKRLEELGISWDPTEEAWNIGYAHAKQYKETYGELNVPSGYSSDDGYKLGAWIANQRTRSKNGRLTEEQREKLEEIGMQWAVLADRWQIGYEHAKAYFEKSGALNVPSKYVCSDGFALNNWIVTQRKAYKDGKLTHQRIRLLQGIGMIWNANDKRWNDVYEMAAAYYRVYGNLNVPSRYKAADGTDLWEWIRAQRDKYCKGNLSDAYIGKLNEIGMIWDKDSVASPVRRRCGERVGKMKLSENQRGYV